VVSPDPFVSYFNLYRLQKKTEEGPKAPDEGDIQVQYSSDWLCSQSIPGGTKKKYL
jgi:hypothetical protein